MKTLAMLPLAIAISFPALADDVRKVKLGAMQIDGIITEISPIATGAPINLGNGLVVENREYFLTLEKNGKEMECRVGRLPDPEITSGNRVKIAGKVTEHRSKSTNALVKVEIGGCKILEHSPTERSMPRRVEGVIVAKSDSPQLGLITFTVSGNRGLNFDCTVSPGSEEFRLTSRRELTDSYSQYRKNDRLYIEGYPDLPRAGRTMVHGCRIIAHEEADASAR